MQQLVDSAFRFIAQQAEDLEVQRKSAENRLRIFTRPVDVPDKDGKCRGKGYPVTHPDVILLQTHIDRLRQSEKEFKKSLEKTFKKNSPLVSVVQQTYGLGIPMTVKLLGLIGDPYIHPAKIDPDTGEVLEPERPRTMSELFSYCGLTPQARKRRGSACKYNPQAQATLWNMAEAVQKIPAGKSHLKDVWTYYKEYYQTRIDDKGKPWNWTHVKNASHRKVGREILKLLYFEAEKLHQKTSE